MVDLLLTTAGNSLDFNYVQSSYHYICNLSTMSPGLSIYCGLLNEIRVGFEFFYSPTYCELRFSLAVVVFEHMLI